MGLYDNYKLSFSQGVVPFTGSVVPELRAVKQEMDTASRQTLETSDAVENMLATAPVNDFDKPAQEQLIAETKQQLDKIKSGNLAFGADATRQLAGQVTARLNGLAIRNKQLQEYEKEMKQTGLNPETIEFNIERVKRENGPATIDEQGRVPQLSMPKYARQVDNTEMARKAVIAIVEAKGQTVGKESMPMSNADGSKYTIQTSTGILEVTAEELRDALERTMAADRDWQLSVEQESRAKAFGELKNISDEELNQLIQDPASPLGQSAAKVMAENPGITAREALEHVKAESNRINKEEQLKDYVAAAAKRTTQNTEAYNPMSSGTGGSGETTGDLTDEQWLAGISTNATATSPTAKQTAADLTKSLDTYNKEMTDLQTRMKADRLVFENPINKGTTAQAAAVSRHDADLLLWKELNIKKQEAIQARNNIYDEVSREVFKKPLKDLKQAAKVSFKENLGKRKFALSDRVVLSSKEADAMFEALDNHEYTVKSTDKSEFGGSSQRITINGKEYTDDETQRILESYYEYGEAANYAKVRKEAEKRLSTKPQMVTTSIPLTSTLQQTMNSVVRNAPLYTMDGETEVTKDVTWGDSWKVLDYKPELGMSVVETNGKTYLADVSNSYLPETLGRELFTKRDPRLRAFGRDILLDQKYKVRKLYEQAFAPGKDPVAVHPLGKTLTGQDIPLTIAGVGNVKVLNRGNNNFVFLSPTAANGVIQINGRTNFTFAELNSMLNDMLPEEAIARAFPLAPKLKTKK